MLNFCTLFNSNYLAKGVTLIRSLIAPTGSVHIYIVPFDRVCENILNEINFPNTTIIPLDEFETKELLQIKQQRTTAEYCWTSTPFLLQYCIQKFDLDHCTYLDADLFFFSDPVALHGEFEGQDAMITEHRYTPEYDQSAISGKYCVQYVTIRNNTNGMQILQEWKENCLEWCYARYEDGKFGDQMYLDHWKKNYTGVHELQNLGGGVAPWNVQQYSFARKGEDIVGTVEVSGAQFKVIFYHFHALYAFRKSFIREFYFEGYKTPESARSILHRTYLSELKRSYRMIKKIDSGLDPLGTKELNVSWIKYLKILRRRIINRSTEYSYWIHNG